MFASMREVMWVLGVSALFGSAATATLADPPGDRSVAVSVSTLRAACAPDTTALIDRVRALSAPALVGRGNGSREALAAADSVARWLGTAGAGPLGEQGWFQDFPLHGEAWASRKARNVIGLLPGTGALAGRFLVVGAHYDHLGRVEGDSAAYFPGADDNASGVSALVELARLCSVPAEVGASGGSRRAIVLVAFAGEEIGLQGSRHFVRNLPVPRDSVDAMINLDTVGRLREGRLYIGGAGTTPAFGPLLATAGARHGLDLQVSQGGWDASDHVAFNEVGVPVLFLFTGANEQYHSPSDVWTLLTPGGLARVTCFALDLLHDLRARPGRLPYVGVAMGDSTSSAASGGGATAGAGVARAGDDKRRAWFGAIPEFVEGVGGVQFAGVMPGSPAAAAGLVRGDILTRFAGQAITDLAGFTAALRAHAPGDRVEVEVKRGDQLLRLSVALAQRR